MKALRHILSILAIVTVNANYAQTVNIEWQKTFGGTDEDKAYSVCILVDGSIVIAGASLSNNGDVSGNHIAWGGAFDFWVIKLDSNGNLLWQKCYGGNSEEVAYSIKPTFDGGFIIAGSAMSTDGDVIGLHASTLPYDDYWVIKIDGFGNLQWKKCYGGSTIDRAYDIEQTSDSGYILSGMATSWDGDVTFNHFPGFNEAWIVKLDSFGTLQWQKSLGGTNDDDGYAIKQTSDGGYAVGVLTGSNDGDVNCTHGVSDYWLIKLDNGGNIQWTQCYGGSSSDALFSIDVTQDHGFYLAGTTDSNDGDVVGSNGLSDIWVVKADSIGNLQWAKCFGGSGYDDGWSVKTTSDSGAIIVGESYSHNGSASCYNTTYSDVLALKIDKLGNLQWSKCMGGMREDAGRDVAETYDMGYLVVGYTKSNDGDVSGNHGGTCVSDSCPDFWVVKLAPLGTSEMESDPFSDFSLHFNNENQILILSTFSYENTKIEMQIFDVTGRILLQEPFTLAIGFNNHQFITGDLSEGVYFVRLQADGGAVTKKVVIQ